MIFIIEPDAETSDTQFEILKRNNVADYIIFPLIEFPWVAISEGIEGCTAFEGDWRRNVNNTQFQGVSFWKYGVWVWNVSHLWLNKGRRT